MKTRSHFHFSRLLAFCITGVLLLSNELNAQTAATQDQTADHPKQLQTTATTRSPAAGPSTRPPATTATAQSPAPGTSSGTAANKTSSSAHSSAKPPCTATAAGPPPPPTRPQDQAADLSAKRNTHTTPKMVLASSSSGSATDANAASASKTPPQPGMVWADPDSRTYEKSGSRWYGKTRQGKWMTEQDAVQAGYHEASQ